MTVLECVKYCAHCGHPSPQKVSFEKHYVRDWVVDGGKDIPILYGKYYISICSTCNNLLLYTDDDYPECVESSYPGFSPRESFSESKLLWPNVAKLDVAAIPQAIVEIYSEASKIKLLSPSSFVVQIRRALEAICLDQGIAAKHTLHGALKELTTAGKLPPLLSEVTNVIKIIGNAGAHAQGNRIYIKHAEIIDDFFKVILEYLYVAPVKLEKFKVELSKFEHSLQKNQTETKVN